MTVAAKVRYLRFVEGNLRGLDRPMTQSEVIAAIRSETGRAISQPYLSQIESGQRRHLTNTTRLLLAQFFKVHPGYLVDDPEGFETELLSPLAEEENQLDLWLAQGAERFRKDPELAEALLQVARQTDTRHCLLLLSSVLDTPGLLDRLSAILHPPSDDPSRKENLR